MTSYWQASYCIQGIIIMEVGLRNKNKFLLIKKKILKIVKSPKQNEDSLNSSLWNLFYTYIFISK